MRKFRVILFLLCGIIWGQWNLVNTPGGQPISRLICDEQQLIAATVLSELYTSNDDGVTWQEVPDNEDLFQYGVDLLHKIEDYVFVSQNIFSDNINHRLNLQTGIWEAIPYQNTALMNMLSNRNQIYSIIEGGIAISNDLGLTWDLLNQPPIEGYINLLYLDAQYLYVNHGCNLYRTANNGNEWENITGVLDDIGPPEPYSCTSLSDMEIWNDHLMISVYWYGGIGNVFYSSDHGDNWNYIDDFPSQSSSGYGNNYVSAILSHNNVLYMGTATSQDGLYYTHDLLNWHDYSSGMLTYDLSISNLIASDEYIFSVGSNTHKAELIESQLSGDINIDGSVDILDIIKLISFILGFDLPTDIEFMAADQNNDGILDVLDIVLLVDQILSAS